MRVSDTEPKTDLGKNTKKKTLKFLRGVLADADMTRDEIREERLNRHNKNPE